MRNTLAEKKHRDRLQGGDREKIEEALQDTIDWLGERRSAENNVFKAKQKDLDDVVNPIMIK
eukprot:7416404-Alexandrium_andersonii.AAC.1